MSKKIFIMGTLLTLSLTGCGDSLNNIRSQNISSVQHSLNEPLSDLLYGFTKMEKFVAKGEYANARTLSRNLSDEFHDAILPPLTVKKGETYAENIHEKYDELEDAIASQNKSKITELIKINRENIKTIAPILGVSLISF